MSDPFDQSPDDSNINKIFQYLDVVSDSGKLLPFVGDHPTNQVRREIRLVVPPLYCGGQDALHRPTEYQPTPAVAELLRRGKAQAEINDSPVPEGKADFQ